ncbi:MAG: hypothetical protein ACTSWR_04390 [Candidatus Helarchaeota archaeon]
MFKLNIEGFDATKNLIEVHDIEEIKPLELKNDYFTKLDMLILEKDNYSIGKEINKIITDKKVETPLMFIYGKAESIECGILFSKAKKMKIQGVWPDKFYEAIKKDADIFKSLLYRLVKTPEFFKEVKLFTYTKSPIMEKEEKEAPKEVAEQKQPTVPKKPEVAPEKPEEAEEYIIPELPYKKKITTKVNIDFEMHEPPSISTTSEMPEESPESYGESLISEIEEIVSSFTYEGAKKDEEEVEFWDNCPFCFTKLSENTIKLLKAGLSTFCPNSKCRKLIKAEYMVKSSKK